MKRLALAAVLALACASPALADFDQGLLAYRAGDFDRAWSEFLEDAASGHATAQFNLGVLCYRGEGVDRDLIEAYAWIELATQQRQDAELIEAQQVLAVMLTPEQLVQGQARAERLAQHHGLAFRPNRAPASTRLAGY